MLTQPAGTVPGHGARPPPPGAWLGKIPSHPAASLTWAIFRDHACGRDHFGKEPRPARPCLPGTSLYSRGTPQK